MQKIILLSPSIGDNNSGTYWYFRALEFELSQMGRAVDLIDFRSDSALPRLIRSMEDGGGVVYSNFFSDLRVSATNHFCDASLFDLYGARPFLLCADMPYKSFMIDRLRHARSTTMILLDKTYEALIRLLNPSVQCFSVMETYVSHQQLAPVPWNEREIDVLIPMTFSRSPNSIGDLVARVDGVYKGLVLDYYEAIRDNRTEDPLVVFNRLFTAVCGHDVREACARDDTFILRVCAVLDAVDDIVRVERRINMVRALLADVRPFGRVVAMVPNNPFRDVSENIECIGYQKLRAMHPLMLNSRIVLNVHPVIPHGTHERVADTLMCGAVLVTDENERLKESMAAGIHYLPARLGRSLAETVEGVDLAEVASAGYALAQERFTMARHAAYLDNAFRSSGNGVSRGEL